MPDLRWDDVASWFHPEWNGALPDLHVPDTTAEDWQAVVDLVRSKGWAYEYLVGSRATRLPARVEDFEGWPNAYGVTLRVWPTPGVLAIFRPRGPDQLDWDVDLRELQGQERLDVLRSFIRAIGRRLRKPVLMTPEGTNAVVVLRYDVDEDRVVQVADP